MTKHGGDSTLLWIEAPDDVTLKGVAALAGCLLQSWCYGLRHREALKHAQDPAASARLSRRGDRRDCHDPASRFVACGQDGTDVSDEIYGSAYVDSRMVALCGNTYGAWDTTNEDDTDFAAVALDPSDGTEIWRWQVSDSHGQPSWLRWSPRDKSSVRFGSHSAPPHIYPTVEGISNAISRKRE